MQGSIIKIIERNNVKYRQLEYLESTGTQYINTGFIPSNKTRILAKFKPKNVSSVGTRMLFGTQGTSSARTTQLLVSLDSRLNLAYNWDWHSSTFTGLNINTVYEYDIDIPTSSVKINGNSYNYGTIAYIGGMVDLYIFADNRPDIGTENYSQVIIYGFKIWDNGVLVRDFIPVERDTDKVIGMLDLVSNSFYGNSGTGTFVKGDYVKVEHIYKPKHKVKTYEILDYIESSGTQYIDTGIVGNTISKIDVKAYIAVDPVALKTFGVIDEITSSSFKRLHIGVSGNGVYAFGFKKDAIATSRGQTEPPHPIIVDITNNKYTVNGEEYSFSTSGEYPTSTFRLFGRNSNVSTRKDAIAMKLYYVKFYVSGVLAKDFIPVKRLKDNVYGLLDKLTNTFYANEGTGVFASQSLSTPEYIEEEVEQVDYIENAAQSYIDLGIGCDRIKNIELEFMGTSWSSDQILFGAFTQEIKGCNYPQVQPSTTGIYGNGSSKRLISRAPSLTKKCKVTTPITSTGTAYFYEDNVQAGSAIIPTANREINNMLLFTLNLNGSASPTHYTKMKVYSFKGWGIDDKLLFDLVPVKYRTEYCMLDLVQNKLYYNDGTGNFTGGTRTEVKKITNVFIHNNTKYAHLDYIKSDLLSDINTGVKCNADLQVEMDMKLPTTTYSVQQVFGAIEKVGASSYRRFHFGVSSTSKWFCGLKANSVTSTFNITTNKSKIIIDAKNMRFSVDGESVSVPNSGAFPTTLDFHIFKRVSNDSTYAEQMEFYLYSMKMKNADGLVRDFIPVERLNDGVKGLFDKVNKVFYTNTGTGVFAGNKKEIILVE